ncbi:MAG: T9SS type A sorting domain-containing protein [Bacteroidota bacterium]
MDSNISDGNNTFEYLYSKYIADNYTYESGNYARWMTNSLALIDYCIAYDLLAGSGYFENQNKTAEKTAIRSLLIAKAEAIFQRVMNFRTGWEVATAKTVNYDPVIINEGDFHAQIGNHRIIVASGLGVAAYLFNGEAPHASLWLEYAKKDVEHFLLNIQRYPTKNGFIVNSQNVEGAFPEGIEYLNYSAEGFIPFMIANKKNEAGTYFQNNEFKKMMDWVYDLQLPNGSGPQINSTGYNKYPVNALVGTEISGGSKYLGQLNIFKSVGATVGLPVEGFALLNTSAFPGNVTFTKITNKNVQGEVILRDKTSNPTRYVIVSAKNNSARYEAELHGYADAGSFIFGTDNRTFVRQPGYSDYSNSIEHAQAISHSSLCPVVNDTIRFDAPNRSLALPPTAEATIVNTKSTNEFLYSEVLMDIKGSHYVDRDDNIVKNELTGILAWVGNEWNEYAGSRWMTKKIHGDVYGSANRKFLMVNNSYLVVRDDITRTNSSMQYAVSFIQGNNGDYVNSADYERGFNTNGNESTWDRDYGASNGGITNGPVLRVNTTALGGKINLFSGKERAVNQNMSDPNIDPRTKVYHTALKTAGNFTDNYGQILSILEIDNNAATKSSITTKRNSDADPYLLYTVDGRGKTYGRYDVIFSKKSPGDQTISISGLPNTIRTNASYLIMSFNGSDFNNASDVKIFSTDASYINYGGYTFLPNDDEVFQTSFAIQKANTSSDLSAISSGSQNKIVRSIDGGLHKVYESLGHVWYEYSYDNGITWKFANNGMPLDSYLGKSPSISTYSYEIAIVFQEENTSSSDVKLMWFSTSNQEVFKINSNCRKLQMTVNEYTITDLQPVISIDNHGPGFLCIWKEPDGLYYYDGHSNPWNIQIGPYKIANTNAYSTNPTIAYSIVGDGKKHIAWDENNQIFYTYGAGLELSNSGLIKRNLSIGCGYDYNYQPSIIACADNSARISWVGKRYEGAEELLAKSQVVSGWKYKTIFTGNTNGGGPFWVFGSDVNTTNLNLNSGGNGYIVAWSKSNGLNEYTRSSTLGGSIRTYMNSSSPIYGKDVQVIPGSSYSNMYGMILNTQSSPYRMIRSDSIIALGKEESANEIFSGRQGVVYKDRAQFYFILGDISVDEINIEFEEKPDSVIINTKNDLNQYLVSKPFNLTNTSNFLYSAQFGFTDSSSAMEVLQNENSVTFTVQLIDENTKQIIGQFDDVTFNSNNVFQYYRTGYKVNTNGIENRSVRLRLIVKATFDAKYSLVQGYNSESVIGMNKDGRDFKQIGFRGALSVTQYELSQNYPNPFNPVTTISYAIPQDGMTALKIYDALGREVITLVNEVKSTGRYSVTFNASKLASGMYIFKLTSGTFTETKKMMLVK